MENCNRSEAAIIAAASNAENCQWILHQYSKTCSLNYVFIVIFFIYSLSSGGVTWIIAPARKMVQSGIHVHPGLRRP